MQIEKLDTLHRILPESIIEHIKDPDNPWQYKPALSPRGVRLVFRDPDAKEEEVWCNEFTVKEGCVMFWADYARNVPPLTPRGQSHYETNRQMMYLVPLDTLTFLEQVC